jgi:hypothetical protein
LPRLSEFCSLLYTTPIEDYLVNTTFHNLKAYNSINEYTDFITQPLTKGMFVPCDEEGNVLIEPINTDKYYYRKEVFCQSLFNEDYDQYQQAKERVLFEAVNMMWLNIEVLDIYKTIEDAINAGVKLKLKGWK